MAGWKPAMPAFDNKVFVGDEGKSIFDHSAASDNRRTSRLSGISYVTAIDDPKLANERKSQGGLGPSFALHELRRGSRISKESHASYVTAFDDNISDVTSYYYNELAPEQGFAQAAADGLRRVPTLLHRRRASRVSFAADLVTVRTVPDSPLADPPETIIAADVVAAQVVNDDQLSKQKKMFLLFLLCTTNLCLAMCYSLIAPFFPGEMLRKGGTATLSGVVISSYDFLRCFLSPVFGLYIDKIGPRFMLVIGPLVAAYCTVLFGFVEKFPPGVVMFTIFAVLLRMMAGVGNNAYVVVSIAIRPVLFAGFMSFAFGIIQASYTTGIIVGPAVGSVLYDLGGFGLPFYVIGGITLTLTAIQIFAVPDLSKLDIAAAQQKLQEEASKATRSTRRPSSISTVQVDEKTSKTAQLTFQQPGFIAFCRNPKILFTFVLYASFGFSVTFYSANLALHVRPLLGENPDSKVGYIILVAGVTEVIMAPFAGLSLDYCVPPALAIAVGYTFNFVGLALIGPSPILVFLSTKLWLVIVGSAVFGLGIGCALSAPYKLATQYVLQAGFSANQQTFGLLAGCFACAYGIGSFLGPLTGGALHDLVGYPWASTMASVYLLIMTILVIVTSMWARLQRIGAKIPWQTPVAELDKN